MIKVLDSIMGTGKTTSMFKMMKEKEGRYLYISMFLDEVGDGNTQTVGRIQKELPDLNFKMPKNVGEGKLESLKRMVSNGDNIASTHALFGTFDLDVVELLVEGGYTLVIDEAVDCVGMYDGVNESDIQAMFASEMLRVLDNGRLEWNEVKYPKHNGKYSEVREYCNLGSLFLHRQKILIWEYPPKLLELLGSVYIMSYLFEGSVMSCWLKVNGLSYEYIEPSLFGLLPEITVKQMVRENLVLLDSTKLNTMVQKDTTFSSTWYKDNLDKGTTKFIKGVMESCLINNRVKSGEIFWTCFKEHKAKLQGKGYSKALKGKMEPFLACNTKATNNYRDHTLCMYTVNIFKNPVEVGYLRDKGVELDKDKYALSEMLQFIFRGCVRQGKVMKVLVLSKRMRKLLEGWLKNE